MLYLENFSPRAAGNAWPPKIYGAAPSLAAAIKIITHKTFRDYILKRVCALSRVMRTPKEELSLHRRRILSAERIP